MFSNKRHALYTTEYSASQVPFAINFVCLEENCRNPVDFNAYSSMLIHSFSESLRNHPLLFVTSSFNWCIVITYDDQVTLPYCPCYNVFVMVNYIMKWKE